MDRWRRTARWLNLLLLFVLPGAACGLLPLFNAAAVPGGAGILDWQEIPLSGQPQSQMTATPFQPLANTPTPIPPTAVPVEVIVPEGLLTAQEFAATATAQALLPPAPPVPMPAADPFRWHGLQLSAAGGPLRLVIAPPAAVNWGNPVEVAFQVGYPCEYADHRACLSAHEDGRLLLATVHSGVGGEGDLLRHAIEGTGFNRAGYDLGRISANVAGLVGAPLRAEQGGVTVNLRVVAAGRVPAVSVQEYFSLPFDEALALAGLNLEEELAQARAGESALLVIETCGWRHPDEPWAPGISDTTGSVYLVVFGE